MMVVGVILASISEIAEVIFNLLFPRVTGYFLVCRLYAEMSKKKSKSEKNGQTGLN